MNMRIVSIAFSLSLLGLLYATGTASAQYYNDVDPDVYDYCVDRAESRSGYQGNKPDRDLEGGVVGGAIGGAILGSIFSDKKDDAVAGAIIGGIFGGIKREQAKDDEARKRRAYRREFESCIERRR